MDKKTLENLLSESEQTIKRELKIQPNQTKLVFLDELEWQNFAQHWQTESAIGAFVPRKQIAYIKETNDFENTLPVIFHEYFGHGLYCARASHGKQIVTYEKRLAKLEEKILGANLPERNNILLVHSAEPNQLFSIKSIPSEIKKSLIEEKIKIQNYDFILLCNKKDITVKEYFRLKKQSDSFFKNLIPIYEGFAVWMEQFLLKQQGYEDTWNHRQIWLTEHNQQYIQFFSNLKNIETQTGKQTLLYLLGFPKNFERENILAVVKENLNEPEKVKYIVLYGSKRPYCDLDLLVVLDTKNPTFEHRYSYHTDITTIDEIQFMDLLRKHDIHVTEPILTGELMFGKESDFNNFHKEMESTKPDTNFLEKTGYKCYSNAILFYEKGQLLYALNDLSFALSYVAFARRYKEDARIQTLANILHEPKNKIECLLSKVMSIKKRAEHQKISLSEETLDGLFNQAKQYMDKQP